MAYLRLHPYKKESIKLLSKVYSLLFHDPILPKHAWLLSHITETKSCRYFVQSFQLYLQQLTGMRTGCRSFVPYF